MFSQIHHLLHLASNWWKFFNAFLFKIPHMVIELYAATFTMFMRAILPPKEESMLNEVCLLIGAGKSPVGVQLAMKLSEANAKVVLVDRPSDAYESIVRKIKESGEMAFFYECDVTDKNQVVSLIDGIEKDVGRITKVFHGNLLMDQANDRDLMFSYINLVETILPRMQSINKGHLIFLSLINGLGDYNHHKFVQGIFESCLSETRSTNKLRGGKVYFTQANVHKTVLTEYAVHNRPDAKFGIFGQVPAVNAAKEIVRGVKQKKLYITLPLYMTHVPKYLGILPRKTAYTIVDLMYRIY